jgi:hypothetical protein
VIASAPEMPVAQGGNQVLATAARFVRRNRATKACTLIVRFRTIAMNPCCALFEIRRLDFAWTAYLLQAQT